MCILIHFFVFFIPWNNLHNATIIPPRDKNLKIIFLYVNTEKLGCLMYQLFESWGCLGKSWERKVKTNAGFEEGSDSTKLSFMLLDVYCFWSS